MKNALQFMQLLDRDGRANIPLFLLLVWSGRVLTLAELSWFQVIIGLFFVLNYQVDRFFRSQDHFKLAEKERKRLDDLEGQLTNISAHLTLANQRSMF